MPFWATTCGHSGSRTTAGAATARTGIPYELTYTADELAAEHTRGVVRAGVKQRAVRGISRLDCTRLFAAFPDLTRHAVAVRKTWRPRVR